MRKTEAAKRNLRHSKKRVAGLRRYGKPEARAFRDWKRAEKAALARHQAGFSEAAPINPAARAALRPSGNSK